MNNTHLAEYMKATEGAVASFTLNVMTKFEKAKQVQSVGFG
jgi:hypothetical protein